MHDFRQHILKIFAKNLDGHFAPDLTGQFRRIFQPGKTPQVHHLIEKRLKAVPEIDTWLGTTNTDKWKGIVLTAEDHQAFTNSWIQQIGKKNMTEPNTVTATLQEVKNAAKKVYANHPAILEILGLD